ncbi:MAG: hypothetical protein IT529_06225 [Burkholderiales bacterium]|nr:hypothetical protein [Burkholderiales bacterium]
MKCSRVPLPGGGVAIVCGARRVRVHLCACGARATLQCDWKVPGGKSGTCDAWICGGCAQEVGPDKHLCAEHQAAYREWKTRRAPQEETGHAT